MAPRFKILRNPDILSFSLKKSRQVNSLQVPQWGPYGERYLLTGHFRISLNVSLFIFPSESPVREPLPCSLIGSPWTGIPRHQSHWSIYSFIHVCLPESPKRNPPAYGEQYKVTVHGDPCRRKAYILCAITECAFQEAFQQRKKALGTVYRQ
jgi:hypothetical protein